MAGPRIHVLGVQRLDVSDALVAEAMALKYGALAMTESARTAALAHVRDELEGAALLELRVESRDVRFSVDDSGQADCNQAPYAATFLNAGGSAVLGNGVDVPEGPELRIAFFLHCLDPDKPLWTTYGNVALPKRVSMPARLRALVPCEPVT